MNNSGFSTKGGAGLGLIDMARKSSGKLNFEFAPVDDGYFYYLNLNIALDKHNYNEELAGDYISDTMKLHQEMISVDAQIIFKGLLHENNLNHLSNQIDTTYNESEENKGMSVIMTELLKNVAKHACSKMNHDGKPGVSMLQKLDEGYAMFSGNFIEEEKEELVYRSLEAINNLSTAQFNVIIERKREENKSGKGMGLMRLRRISGHDIGYEMVKYVDDPHYFILKIELS